MGRDCSSGTCHPPPHNHDVIFHIPLLGYPCLHSSLSFHPSAQNSNGKPTPDGVYFLDEPISVKTLHFFEFVCQEESVPVYLTEWVHATLTEITQLHLIPFQDFHAVHRSHGYVLKEIADHLEIHYTMVDKTMAKVTARK
jgi:hypothetical protein